MPTQATNPMIYLLKLAAHSGHAQIGHYHLHMLSSQYNITCFVVPSSKAISPLPLSVLMQMDLG